MYIIIGIENNTPVWWETAEKLKDARRIKKNCECFHTTDEIETKIANKIITFSIIKIEQTNL